MKLTDTLQRFMHDKDECLVYFTNGTYILAFIKEIGDDYIILDEKDSESVVNLANVLRIRSYPKNEKGKKKAIFV
ncbi:MAG: hypothetical protein MJ081_07515 [Ruminococcus sp.]|nr:hypothetical protein [Ruminococcus sp.]